MQATGVPSPNHSPPTAAFRGSASFLHICDPGGQARSVPRHQRHNSRHEKTMTVALKHAMLTLADGSTLAYTLRAAAITAAPKLVLIHSLALDRSIWDSVVERLESVADILTYDCRGHGLSDRAPRPYSAELFARDLAELLDHVGWEQAIVAGCSMGGCVALAFGGLFPQRTSALGLIDTTAWYGPKAAANFKERAEAARAKGMAALFDFQSTRWFSDEFRAQHPDVLKRTLDVFVATDVECYVATCQLLGDVDARGYLADFRMPVAIVVGEEDYATPVEMARELHAAIPQSTLTIVAKARHLTPIEFPDVVSSQLRALMGRADGLRA
jgi:3-oxoadipate enol-lactonase